MFRCGLKDIERLVILKGRFFEHETAAGIRLARLDLT